MSFLVVVRNIYFAHYYPVYASALVGHGFVPSGCTFLFFVNPKNVFVNDGGARLLSAKPSSELSILVVRTIVSPLQHRNITNT